jgi:hypothetical protein
MRASPNFQRSLMTESIVPETAVKLAISPKPATKTPPTPEAPNPSPGTLSPPTGGGIRSPLGHVRHKKQAAIVASALFSLIAGIAGVRLMWPATDQTNTAQAPNQALPDDSKQIPGSPAAAAGTTGTTKPQSENLPPPGLPIPTATPSTGLTSPGVQQPFGPAQTYITPGASAPFQLNAAKQPERYMITDQVLADLRKASMTEAMLSKLSPLKNQVLSQEDMVKEIAFVLSAFILTAVDKEKYQSYILHYAKQPDTPAYPSGNSTGQTGSQPGYGMTPLMPPPPPNLGIPTPSPNYPAPPPPNLGIPTPSPNYPAPQPVSPIVPGVGPEQFGPAGSHNHPNPNPTSGTQTQGFTGLPTIPSPPTLGVAPAGGFQAPQSPVTPPPLAPTVPPLVPVFPSPTPIGPPPPSFGSGQSNTVPGVVIPQPPASAGLPGTPMVGIPNIPVPNGSGATFPAPTVFPDPSMGSTPINPRPPFVPVSPPSEFGNSGGPSGTSAANHLTKPPASPSVTPATAIERSPTTSYDVDLYELKANDTWETISQEFYNDKRYAAALQAANPNKTLTAGGWVDIPPIYILKQKFQTPAGTRTPIGQPTPPASPPPSWAPSISTTPAPPNGGSKTYKVPPGGISMRAIARNFLGSDQRWNEIYNLNPQLRPDLIPEGTDVRLPADAKLPN